MLHTRRRDRPVEHLRGRPGVRPDVGDALRAPAGEPDHARDLFTINTSTGAATLVGDLNLPTSDLSAMAFDSTGNLYVIDTQNGEAPEGEQDQRRGDHLDSV